MERTPFGAFLFSSAVQRSLFGPLAFDPLRKHLVRGDSGHDRRIAATDLANRFLHSAGPEVSNVGQYRGETLFTLGYVLSFTVSDGADSMLRKAKRFGNLQRTPIGVSE